MCRAPSGLVFRVGRGWLFFRHWRGCGLRFGCRLRFRRRLGPGGRCGLWRCIYGRRRGFGRWFGVGIRGFGCVCGRCFGGGLFFGRGGIAVHIFACTLAAAAALSATTATATTAAAARALGFVVPVGAGCGFRGSVTIVGGLFVFRFIAPVGWLGAFAAGGLFAAGLAPFVGGAGLAGVAAAPTAGGFFHRCCRLGFFFRGGRLGFAVFGGPRCRSGRRRSG